ncbi:MAG: ATP-binding cassette domain-containing protein, partial [Muribaculaceae bacterium]|nr:ATP-binding cassette domain-containing protein [Muribaculaceae bacterium]
MQHHARRWRRHQVVAQPVAAYSHGMKQKLAIISAWIHEPKLILMDEPFV